MFSKEFRGSIARLAPQGATLESRGVRQLIFLGFLVGLLFLSLAISSAFAAPSAPPSATKGHRRDLSLMDPHRPSASGPWFEGWYYRLTDKAGHRSIAVIVATTLRDHDKVRRMENIPGYVAILVSEGDGRKTRSFEAFPQQTTIRSRGLIDFESHDFDPRTDFEWSAPGYGKLTKNRIDIRIPGVVGLSANLGGPLTWDAGSPLTGPEGISAFIPAIPLHWHVFSLGTDTKYSFTAPAEDGSGLVNVSGDAWIHQEKNWGVAFPTAWIWSQGIAPGNEAQFAVAGGRLNLAGVDLTTFLVGYRSPQMQVDFRPSDLSTRYTKIIDPCNGTIELRAANLKNEMVIRARAPLETFAPVSIPTRTGYQTNGGKESFSATVEVEVYGQPLLSALGLGRLIERRVFTNAALELGAEYQTCTGSPIN